MRVDRQSGQPFLFSDKHFVRYLLELSKIMVQVESKDITPSLAKETMIRKLKVALAKTMGIRGDVAEEGDVLKAFADESQILSIYLKNKVDPKIIAIITARYQVSKKGEKVIINPEPAVHKSLPFRRFIGKVGVVKGMRGNSYLVNVKDGKKEKTIICRPIHLKRT